MPASTAQLSEPTHPASNDAISRHVNRTINLVLMRVSQAAGDFAPLEREAVMPRHFFRLRGQTDSLAGAELYARVRGPCQILPDGRLEPIDKYSRGYVAT